ncbi:MAG: Ig-like domain-containing protein [Luteolibacter sp.]
MDRSAVSLHPLTASGLRLKQVPGTAPAKEVADSLPMRIPPTRPISRLKALLAAAAWIVTGATAPAADAVRLHPGNGHYFLFRERPTVLVGSSEHYGVLINLDFDYVRYLEETRTCGLNFVRVFTGAYRETTGSFNIPENTLSPLPGRSVAPWKRTGQPGAADGGNKFDLNQWDPTYFFRLREFVGAASKRGVVVELTFFSAIYDDTLWNLSPLNAANHVNGVGAGGRANSFSATGDLVPFQKALARKCATELRDFDNVIYEICNEPYEQNITQAWQNLIIDELVATEAEFPLHHLIAQGVYNYQGVVSSPNPAVSLFNFHYASPTAASQNFGLNRALGDDETGNNGREDFTYRREAWEFMLSGGGLFNHLDFSFTTTREDGIASQAAPGGGGPAIRRQFGILRWFLEEMPLVNLTPQPGFVASGVPTGGSAKAMGVPGTAYGLYLRGGTQANLVVNLPAGTYRGQWIDPRSGLVSGAVAEFVHAGGTRSLASPNYSEDIALRLSGGGLPAPEVRLTTPSYNSIIASGTTATVLTADASTSGGTVQGVEFLDGEKSLGSVSTAPYQLTLTDLAEGQHVFRAKVITTDGRTSLSPPIKACVEGAFHCGINLNGGALIVDGQSWQSQSAAVSAGLTVANSNPVNGGGGINFYPAPDASTSIVLGAHLLRASATGNIELGLGYPLVNGYYDVFLFVAEDQTSYSRDMRVSIENLTAARGIGDQAKGEWLKYGPYRTKVEDGTLNIGLQQESKGVPKISGFAVYQASGPPAAADVRMTLAKTGDVVCLTYPAGLTTAKIEASDTLTGGWQELTAPVSNFTDQDVVPVAIDRPSRFFRLRMD